MRDARRRNKNIGTSRSGHGSNNRFKIPERWSDLTAFWQKLSDYVSVEKQIGTQRVTFLVEPTRNRFFHHCTVQDIVRVLKLLPAKHIQPIELIVLRQPTVKQSRLEPVWGRLGYWSEIGQHEGPGIFLEAHPATRIRIWGKSLRPDDVAELERLRSAGFQIESNSRGYLIHSTPGAIRCTQLFRTIPHEIGHYLDYIECKRSFEWGDDYERFWELYDAKPSREKEEFAHRYADDFWRKEHKNNRLPFDSAFDEKLIIADGLRPEWFDIP